MNFNFNHLCLHYAYKLDGFMPNKEEVNLRQDFVLSTDDHIKGAIQFLVKVVVSQDNEILDKGGRITAYSNNSVTINGIEYSRETCEFILYMKKLKNNSN